MPNLLGHIGVQGPLTGGILRGADAKWIYAGLLVPDLPWILQRGLLAFWPGVDPYELRLYAIAQSSLAVSLILCAGLALVSAAPTRIFAVLALNSVLHLLLDACQTKWGTGVLLLAPVSWDFFRLDLFIPESLPTYLITAAGLGFMVWAWRWSRDRSVGFAPWDHAERRWVGGVALAGVYLAVPFLLMSGPEAKNLHSVRTLREYADRPGKEVIFDRTAFLRDMDGTPVIRTFAREDLIAVGELPSRPGTVSVRGVFIHPDTLAVREHQEHVGWPRDELSLLGIFMILLVWVCWFRAGKQLSSGPL